MLSIISEKFERFENGSSVVVAELRVDNRSELPAADALEGRLLGQGSLGWEISTGVFFALAGDGKWYAQDGSGVAGE